MQPLRRKYFLPEEPGSWEATLVRPGRSGFPAFHAGPLSFGLNICTELWALETYASLRRARRAARAVAARDGIEDGTSGWRWAWWRRCARVRSACRPIASTRPVHAAAAGGSSILVVRF